MLLFEEVLRSCEKLGIAEQEGFSGLSFIILNLGPLDTLLSCGGSSKFQLSGPDSEKYTSEPSFLLLQNYHAH